MMDKQQEQMKQNVNQFQSQVGDSDERVNAIIFEEADKFGDAIAEEEKSNKLPEIGRDKPEEEKQLKKSRRPRKTIEQELADLDAKRQKLIEKKRSKDAHKKIIFGSISIKVFKFLYQNQEKRKEWVYLKKRFIEETSEKDKAIIEEIIREIELNI